MKRGVYTPVITVMDNEGNIDYKGNEKVINRLIDRGVDGILFLGSIGEFFTFTMEQRKQFVRFAVKTVNNRVSVMIGTGGTIVEEVVELTSFAEAEGADAVVVISPYYFKLDEESIYRYYAEIAGNVNIPILLYNFPDRTSMDLSPALVLRLAKDFPNIIGIKDTVDNISHTRKLIKAVKQERQDFLILSGFDEYLVPNLMAGGDGIITGLTNVSPELFVEIFKAFGENDFGTVLRLQKKVNILMELYDVSQPFISAIKSTVAMFVEGIAPAVGKPADTLNDEQLGKIKEILKRADLY